MRQLAAVLLRQRLQTAWRRLVPNVKAHIKATLLQLAVSDPKYVAPSPPCPRQHRSRSRGDRRLRAEPWSSTRSPRSSPRSPSTSRTSRGRTSCSSSTSAAPARSPTSARSACSSSARSPRTRARSSATTLTTTSSSSRPCSRTARATSCASTPSSTVSLRQPDRPGPAPASPTKHACASTSLVHRALKELNELADTPARRVRPRRHPTLLPVAC